MCYNMKKVKESQSQRIRGSLLLALLIEVTGVDG